MTSLYGYNPVLFPGTSNGAASYGASGMSSSGNPYMGLVNAINSSVFNGVQPQLYQGSNGFSPLGGFPGVNSPGAGFPGSAMPQRQQQPSLEGALTMCMSMLNNMFNYFTQSNGAGQSGNSDWNGTPSPLPDKPPVQDQNPLPVNFKKNKSIQKRMDQLLSLSKDPAVKAEYAQLKGLDSNSPQGQQAEARLSKAMQNAGYTDKQIAQFGYLKQTLQLNSLISSLKKVKANLKKKSPEAKQLSARITALRNNRAEFEKNYNNPPIGLTA